MSPGCFGGKKVRKRELLAECDADVHNYRHRNVPTASIEYHLVAVDEAGKEGETALVTIY